MPSRLFPLQAVRLIIHDVVALAGVVVNLCNPCVCRTHAQMYLLGIWYGMGVQASVDPRLKLRKEHLTDEKLTCNRNQL